MSDPRIALFDIETAPNLAYVWGVWEQDVIEIERDWYMLSFAYKWLDKQKIYTHALPDYPRFKSDKHDDSDLVKELWRVFDAADIVIAHNGDRFDVRKANARFIEHGLKPPTPYKQIDTLKIARKHFKFDSNRLDDLGRYLGVGRKIPNTGKKLWLSCMEGDPKAWATMRRYNAQDVALLERVYLRIRGWATTHPDLAIYSRSHVCPSCQSPRITQQGVKLTKTGYRQQYKCQACGGWHSGAKHFRAVA